MDSSDPDRFVDVRDGNGSHYRVPAAILRLFVVTAAGDARPQLQRSIARLEASLARLRPDEAAEVRRAARDVLEQID